MTHFAQELIDDITAITLDVFKQNVAASQTNIYNEAVQKSYYDPIRITAVIVRDLPANATEEFGYDQSQDLVFGFLRETLKDIDLVLEVGDLFRYDGKWFEASHVFEGKYWAGINPNTMDDNTDRGLSSSVTVITHRTRTTAI